MAWLGLAFEEGRARGRGLEVADEGIIINVGGSATSALRRLRLLSLLALVALVAKPARHLR